MSKRIPQLDPQTSAASDDLLPIYSVQDDSTNYIEVGDLFVGAPGQILKVLSANASGTDVATAQAWFPTAGGAAVESSTAYMFEGYLRTSRAAGAVSHTTSLLFAGSAVLSSIAYRANVNTGDVVTNLAQNQTSAEVATATVVKAASTSTTEQISIYVKGIVRVTTGGTFIPQFQYSAAPGGVPTILANSYFSLVKIGASSVTTIGTWS